MFHTVHIKFRGHHRGYEIWCDNLPFITLDDGLELKRNEAYKLSRSLNLES